MRIFLFAGQVKWAHQRKGPSWTPRQSISQSPLDSLGGITVIDAAPDRVPPSLVFCGWWSSGPTIPTCPVFDALCLSCVRGHVCEWGWGEGQGVFVSWVYVFNHSNSYKYWRQIVSFLFYFYFFFGGNKNECTRRAICETQSMLEILLSWEMTQALVICLRKTMAFSFW